MKKVLLVIMLLCVALSIIAMLSPNAYIVASCIPPREGEDWRIPYSYFNIELAGDIFWIEDVLGLGIKLLALVCNSLLVFQLIFRKFNMKSLVFLGVGLFASVLSIPTSTADGYPNCFPFISAIAAVCVVVLLLFHFFSGKLTKLMCFVILFGAFASVFSLFMSHLLTTFGVLITGSYLITILLYIIYIRYQKVLDKAGEIKCDV